MKAEKVFAVADQKNVGMMVCYPAEYDDNLYLATVEEPNVETFKADDWVSEKDARAAFVAGNLVVCFEDNAVPIYYRVTKMKVAPAPGIAFDVSGDYVGVMPQDGFPPTISG